jgi:hypothetical protein
VPTKEKKRPQSNVETPTTEVPTPCALYFLTGCILRSLDPELRRVDIPAMGLGKTIQVIPLLGTLTTRQLTAALLVASPRC